MDLDDAMGMVAPTGPDAVTPDLDEMQQQDPAVPALDVDVIGPVQVHALPARTGVMHNVTVGDTATQILGRDLRRGRVLIWAASGAGQSVAAYDTGDVDASSSVGDELVTIAAASLPAGRYRVDVHSLLSAATTPAARDVLAVAVGGTAVARLLSYNAVQSSSAYQPKQPFTLEVEVDGTQSIAVVVAVAETSTNVQTFDVTLTATPLAAAGFYLGTRGDEVQAGTAALVPAGRPLELKHCEALYAKAAAGTVNLSFVAEQWAD